MFRTEIETRSSRTEIEVVRPSTAVSAVRRQTDIEIVKGPKLAVSTVGGASFEIGRPVEMSIVVGRPTVTVIESAIVRGNSGGGEAGSPYLKLEAGQDLIAYRLVTTDAAGRLIYADAGTLAHLGQVIGVGIMAGHPGDDVFVAYAGLVSNPGWDWHPGSYLFVGLGGEITTEQVGVFSQNIGYARTPTEVFLRLGRAVVRSH